MSLIKKIRFFLLVLLVAIATLPSMASAVQLDTSVIYIERLKLIIISGNNQSTLERIAPEPLVVKVIDENDEPVAGATIGFSFQRIHSGSAGQNLVPQFVLTDASGLASTWVTFGDKFGRYDILARLESAEGISFPLPGVVFNLTYRSSSPLTNVITSITEAISDLIGGKEPAEPSPSLISTLVKPIAKVLETPIKKIEESKVVQTALFALYGLAALSSPLWFLELLNFLYYLFHRFLFLFGLRRKSRPWGVVYDSETKKPMELAIVRIFEIDSDRLLQTQVTDSQGRFGFLVKPGRYRITVSKYQYRFFSEKKDEPSTGPYEEVYFGGEIKVPDYETIVKVNIPGDPKESLSSQLLERESLGKRLRIIIGELAEVLLWIGLLLSVLILIFKPTLLNFAILPLYGLPIGLGFFKKRSQPKTFGKVFDGENNRPLAKAQIRIFNPQNKRLLGLTLSDNLGRYGFVGIPAGKYVLTASKDQYRFEGPKIKSSPDDEGLTGKLIKVKINGIVAESLPLRYVGEVTPEAGGAQPAIQTP